ncbi:hypothetical protein D3C87_1604280 [compost metagenome]
MDVPDRFVAITLNTINRVGGDHRFDRHFVHRQRAGFIRADHGHRAQRFDGWQFANNGLLPGHRLHAKRQNNRNDCR